MVLDREDISQARRDRAVAPGVFYVILLIMEFRCTPMGIIGEEM
jgi:hypothetical protein